MLLPDNILRCMSPSDRSNLGKAGLTAEEACAKASTRAERQQHNILISWLRLHDLWFWHARTDRRSSSTLGTPDFLVIEGGRCLPIELKVGSNKLSIEQGRVKEHLERHGTAVLIAYSAAEAIAVLKDWLGKNRAGRLKEGFKRAAPIGVNNS